MKKFLISLIAVCLLLPAALYADTYSSLWKQYEDASDKDLPQAQLAILKRIAVKAKAEKMFGQLLAAEIRTIGLKVEIAPDSLRREVEQIEQREKAVRETNPVLAAVYQTVLSKIYERNTLLGDDREARSQAYESLALSHPDLLAKARSSAYTPIILEGYDSKIFNNDMLSIIGFEVGNYKVLHDYYLSHDNRPAACLCALFMFTTNRPEEVPLLKKSEDLITIDSLIDTYKDLRVAGELAIERYELMENAEDVTVEERMQYINYALSRWGAWPRMNVLRNKQKLLTNPKMSVTVIHDVNLPHRPIHIRFSEVRNVQEITMRVSRIAIDGDYRGNINDEKELARLRKFISPMEQQTQTRRFIGLPDYQETTDSMQIEGLPAGVYLLEFSTNVRSMGTERSLLRVSDVCLLAEQLPDNRFRFAVVSATTGQPKPQAKIRLMWNEHRGKPATTHTLTTDAHGEAFYRFTGEKPDKAFAYTTDDRFSRLTYNLSHFYSSEGGADRIKSDLYTDRSVYRPGQTVHVGGIVYTTRNRTETKAVAGREMQLTLYDANRKTIEQRQITSDRFGSFSADFTLPATGHLNGNYTVSSDDESQGNVSFTVDEYKRPTFEVKMPEVNQKYHDGDTLIVKAHAATYAGVPVQGAKVSYTVVRNQAYWWWYHDRSDANATLLADTIETDTNGDFRLVIPMVLPKNTGTKHRSYYEIRVNAMVTDRGGETHSAEMKLPLSTYPTAFYCDLPRQSEKDSLKTIRFSYKNMAGQDIAGTVNYSISGMPEKYTAPANEEIPIRKLVAQLKSGIHKLIAVCDNDTIEREIVLFSLSDKMPVVKTHDWFYQTASAFPKDGKPVYVQVGSSDTDTHILYSILSGNKVLKHGTIDLSNEVKTLEYRYKEEYGSGILVTFAHVKEGRFYEHAVHIMKPYPDKKLHLKWATFRNRLTSGQKEEWTLSVTDTKGRPAVARVMAVLYDKALDAITSHNWYFSPYMYRPYISTYWAFNSFGQTYLDASAAYTLLPEDMLDFSLLSDEWLPIGYDWGGAYDFAPEMEVKTRAVMMCKDANVQKEVVEEAKVFDSAVGDHVESVEAEKVSPKETTQLRENLNETAFFYPTLTSDTNGCVALRFTLPESITTWHFMGLAHDTEMKSGMLTDDVVAKKTVMVQPNLPRFVRAGDKANIVARLFNTSETAVSGEAKIEMIDPETDRKVYEKTVKYKVAAGETGIVLFDYQPDGVQPLLICRITAVGKDYSDGEQHYLPILPDKEMVTTTLPFTMDAAGTKNIDLRQLFAVNDRTNRLTVEYTDNPSWLMVQALPSIVSADDDNAISLAALYYTHSLASDILHSSPQIKATLEQWRREVGENSSLVSNLSKNQELKELLLDETPWVNVANNETANKQQLVTFFDENTINHRLSSAIQRLEGLQGIDGSFCWWNGMEGSPYITMEVMNILVRLNKMTGVRSETVTLLDKGFVYMGKAIIQQVERMKREEAKGIVPYIDGLCVDFLYTATLDGRKLPADVKRACDYLLRHLEKQSRKTSIYNKAILSIIFNGTGRQTLAQEYVRSIKEFTVYKEEMGRYYDTRRAAYSWCDYRIPTQVAAIEALKVVTPNDKKTIEEMQKWLLQEKRTQSWDTPINSVNAVYAFLHGRTSVLTAGKTPVFLLDDKKMEMPKASAGLGYVKTTETGADMHMLSIQKESDGTSWGAVYAQYRQDVKNIDNASSGLTVVREVMNGGRKLKVGDRVKVRITIKADRDYDFVQLIDKRAACLEPVEQLSGYRNGYYCSPKDVSTNYYFNILPKGEYRIETEYYVDRVGNYSTGTCTIRCAYAPEYGGRAVAISLDVK